MQLDMLIPEQRSLSIEELRERLVSSSQSEPFHPALLDLLVDFSQRIFRDSQAKKYPELLAVGYWMRKSEVSLLVDQFHTLKMESRMLAPRGLAFHLPPRNVDTMFVYSWLLAALAGNRNVIRLSPLRSESTNTLVRLLRETLTAGSGFAKDNTIVVSYGHEEEPTALLSSLCDVRVIWGGDQTVETIRRFPLAPHARELTFPDRFSLASIHAGAYADLSTEKRDYLAAQFFNDSFWFDQLACSSPRLVVWCGEKAASVAASRDFFERVDTRVKEKRYSLPPAASMQKLIFTCSAILDLPVSDCRRLANLVVLTLDSLAGLKRDHPGGGLFFEVHLNSLKDLSAYLVRRDQTLTWFGFSLKELQDFAASLNGHSIDRIVPIGQALQFHRFWDGNDLMQEFCRCVHLETSPMVFRA